MSKALYSIGTEVYYRGDDINDPASGNITDCFLDSLGELVMEVTLKDGRVLSAITPQDFESHEVLGNTQGAEFLVIDTLDQEYETISNWSGLIGEVEEGREDNEEWKYFL